MSEEEKPKKRGFTIVDKRGGDWQEEDALPASESRQPPPKAPEPPRQASPPPQAQAPPPPYMDEYEEDLPSEGEAGSDLSTSMFLRLITDELMARAFIHMGLIPNPSTNIVSKNLKEARLSIDVLTDVTRHLAPHLSPEERLHLEDRLNQLKLAFVQSGQVAT